MVSAKLSQLTPFERYRLQLYLNILNSNSYRIQIHTEFKFIQGLNSYKIQIHTIIFTCTHSNNRQIFYNIQIHYMYTFSYSQKLQITLIVYRANIS
jgi:hypothetical protein